MNAALARAGMGDKRAVAFPLFFAFFLILVTLTGFFQIRIIRNNIERQLTGEAEVIFSHIQREIDLNLDYLTLLDKSPALITPYFYNVMSYDESIIDNIDAALTERLGKQYKQDSRSLPYANLIEYDISGKILTSKGKPNIPADILEKLRSGAQETVIRMPVRHDKGLLFGRRFGKRIIFVRINPGDLEILRRNVILKDIVDREEKRFNIDSIRIYDEKGNIFVATKDEPKRGTFILDRGLGSKLLPGYHMQIFVSRDLARDTIQRSSFGFILILAVLFISGAGSIYAFFVMERKYAQKVKEMERELELKERLVSLGKLASGMAHEIRNPLNAISLSVQRLKREFLPVEEKKDEYLTFLDIIRKELTRVNGIVEEFLQSTRAQAPFSKESLRELIEEVIIIVGEKASSMGIFIENATDTDITVECQRDRLKQAFYNIIINAIESMPDGGKIGIMVKQKASIVEASIKDSGPGISEEALGRIFEYYYTTKDKGMGLGLPISYMIVKDHGGDIKVSTYPGQGTTFIIVLPKNRGDAMGV
ncbi:MAG: sensor signal transduction histidine kinase [Deltaproteobacteria bacterium]|nr:sensor signal transduction histidine kinase [Deltaproteobacteria bacterium]